MIHDIALALADAMSQVEGLRTSAYPVESPAHPHASVRIGSINYHGAFAGMGFTECRWVITVTVGRVALRSTMQALETLIDPSGDVTTSIPKAIEDDRTLGGKCSSLKVVGVSQVGTTADEEAALVATLEVVTYAEP